MPVDANSIANEVVASVRQSQAGAGGAAAMAAAGPADFCGIWTKAKPILEVVAGIVVLIPGLGATAGAVLQGLIKVGDQVSQQICH
jgi:uncharacterized membrane protein YjjB (DUF3815 family)